MNPMQTIQQTSSEDYLQGLRYCLCGKQLTDDTLHDGCIQSGIYRGMFKDINGWREYCIINGRRVAEYFRSESAARPLPTIIKNES
jgi:hypothetical protein